MFRDHEHDCVSSGHVVYLYRLYLQTVKSWSCLFYVHQALLSIFYTLPSPFIYIYTPSGLLFMVTHEQVILLLITHYQFLFCLYRSSGPTVLFVVQFTRSCYLHMFPICQVLLLILHIIRFCSFFRCCYLLYVQIIKSCRLFQKSSETITYVNQASVPVGYICFQFIRVCWNLTHHHVLFSILHIIRYCVICVTDYQLAVVHIIRSCLCLHNQFPLSMFTV